MNLKTPITIFLDISRIFISLLAVTFVLSGYAVDTDLDGLPDDWEIENGLDPLIADSQISSGLDHSCVIHDSGLFCWGRNQHGQKNAPSLINPIQVSSGGNHTCAIDNSGVVCWGLNDWGQTDVPTLTNVKSVSSGGHHTCATDDSGVVCWGFMRGADVPELNNPTQLSSGNEFACVIDEGEVVCWGRNFEGQLNIPPLENPKILSVGGSSACAIDDSGVVCWGSGGQDDFTMNIPELSNPYAVSLGLNEFACALDDSGVICWGKNNRGQINVPLISRPFQVSGGQSHVCALSIIDGVICWGGNQYGQLNTPSLIFDPDGDTYTGENDDLPFDPLSWIDTDKDGIGDNFDNCINFSNEDQLNFDEDLLGDACDDDDDNDNFPDEEDSFPNNPNEWLDSDNDGIGNNADADDDGDGLQDSLDKFPLDYRYSNDTDQDGLPDEYEEKYGLNKYSYLDAESDNDEDGLTALVEFELGTSPVSSDTDKDTLTDDWEIENGRDPIVSDFRMSIGAQVGCLKDDSGLKCWGEPENSSYYDPKSCTTDDSGYHCFGGGLTSMPIIQNPKHFAVGGVHACVIDDLEVKCWGYNNNGQTEVPNLINPKQVFAKRSTSCAIDDSGLVCWGDSRYDRLTIPELENPYSVSIGNMNICALDDNGANCWGSHRSQINDIPDLDNPRTIAVGYSTACAIDNSGLVCWGGGTDNYEAPFLLGVKEISVDSNNICVLDFYGLKCWGSFWGNFSDFPDVINPRQVDIGSTSACVIDDTGLVCWGSNLDGRQDIPEILFDPDGDGLQFLDDAFPLEFSESNDSDDDGIGDNADTDDDGDGAEDIMDAFPLDSSETNDNDNDGVGDNADTDDDNDGVEDLVDAFPYDASETTDTDSDGVGNNTDDDDDGDGVNDVDDLFPLNELYHSDSDSDGMADAWEVLYGLNPNDPLDTISDQDNDGAVALQEFIEGTLPVPRANQAIFTEAFGGTAISEDGTTFTFPAAAEGWGGFESMSTDLYPLRFTEDGSITFTGYVADGGSADVSFRLEYNPFPDVDPAYDAAAVTVSGATPTDYTVAIPSQGSKTFSSMVMYIAERDVAVTVTDILVNGEIAVTDVVGPATVAVTFQVDMSAVETNADGVYIAGGVFGQDGVLMTDNGSDVWSVTVEVEPHRRHFYKFRNQPSYGTWDGFEDATGIEAGGCNAGEYSDRFVDVVEADIVLPVVAYGSCTAEPYEPYEPYVPAVSFTVTAPGASTVQFHSSGFSWNGDAMVSAVSNGDDTWTATIDPGFEAGVEYKWVVDGVEEDLSTAYRAGECDGDNVAAYADTWFNRTWAADTGDVTGDIAGACSGTYPGPQQVVTANGSGMIDGSAYVTITYDVSDDNANLTGLGLRVHYDSSLLTYSDFADQFRTGLITSATDYADGADEDGNAATDRYININWASFTGLNWPGTLTQDLITLNFSVADVDVDSTVIGFSSSSTAAGYGFSGEDYALPLLAGSLDFDQSGNGDALTDGLLLLRYAFGLRGSMLTAGAVSGNSPLSEAEVEAAVATAAGSFADIDGNGRLDALTDGLILLRYLFGLRGTMLTNGAVANDAMRIDATDIEPYILLRMP
jgi:alpha-tubulin suppressor-like RCC1 family protein